MNLDFSDEQEELRRQVRRVVADSVSYDGLRRMINEGVGHDPGLWRTAGELGWLGAAIPEEHGGLGLSPEELCVIAEELGRVLAPIPFSSSIGMAAEALRLFGSSQQQANYLPRLASGEYIGTFAASEGAASEFSAPAAQYANGRVSGRKLPVPDGEIADVIIVTAVSADGDLKLVAVDTGQAGVSRRNVPMVDELRHHAVLDLDEAEGEPLETNIPGEAALARIHDGAAVYTAFEQVGAADACLEMARAYALERKTFGRVIGSYQALKHRMADMFARTELARSNAYGAAWALATGSDQLPLLAGAARLSATEALTFAASENLQIHGGIGYTFEANCHFYYRRARLLADALGGRAAWSDRVVEALLVTSGNRP